MEKSLQARIQATAPSPVGSYRTPQAGSPNAYSNCKSLDGRDHNNSHKGHHAKRLLYSSPSFFTWITIFRGLFQYRLLHFGFGQTSGSLSVRGCHIWPQRLHSRVGSFILIGIYCTVFKSIGRRARVIDSKNENAEIRTKYLS